MHNLTDLSLTTALERFLNLYWLRPETAGLLTLRTDALRGVTISPNAVDTSCGDGIFLFIALGGEIEDTFDVFEGTAQASKARAGVDVFDGFSDTYNPKITKTPRISFELGIDFKENSLQRAEKLNVYKKLLNTDLTKPLTLESEAFDTVTNFGSLNHYPSVEGFLLEAHRVLKKKGQLIVTLHSENLIRFYKELEKDFSPSWLSLIERNMRGIWPIMHSASGWQRVFENAGFTLLDVKPIAGTRYARMWNIGLRPIASELLQFREIAKKHEPEKLLQIKKSWCGFFKEALLPLLTHGNNPEDSAEILFVLEKQG